jgi:hypothetical protein
MTEHNEAPRKEGVTTLDMANVTEQDFKQFLSEKIKNHGCPCCLSNNWMILDVPNMVFGLVALPKLGGFNMPPPHVPMLSMSCVTCGYIRNHATGIVAQWKADKKAAK